jgi:hypothetical protein
MANPLGVAQGRNRGIDNLDRTKGFIVAAKVAREQLIVQGRGCKHGREGLE